MKCPQDFTSLNFLLYLLLPLLCFLIHLLSTQMRKLPFPPGPPKLPIIGNLPIISQRTPRALAKLAERYGGLFHLRFGFLNVFIVSAPDVARQVLQVQDKAFSNRPASIAITYLTYDRSDMVFAPYGPFWRKMRMLCVTRLFSRRRAESWASVRDEIDAAVRLIAARGTSVVDVGEMAYRLNKNIIFRAAFGSQSHEKQDEFIAIVQEFSRLFVEFNIGDFLPWLRWMDLQGINRRLQVARGCLDEFIDKVIDEHMVKDRECSDDQMDMVDEMLAFLEECEGKAGVEEDELRGSLRLTRDNIKAIIMDVMFGGTETVAATTEWMMTELLTNPDELKRVQQELTDIIGLDQQVKESNLENLQYLKCVIKETLRLHPPIPLLLHETVDDCIINDYVIPAHSHVTVNVWAIGHDKSLWNDVNIFKPSRFAEGGDATNLNFKGTNFEFIPFGSGRRSCPAMQLGMHALELSVAQLLHCFTWELPNGVKECEVDMGDVFAITASKAVPLAAVATPRLKCIL